MCVQSCQGKVSVVCESEFEKASVPLDCLDGGVGLRGRERNKGSVGCRCPISLPINESGKHGHDYGNVANMACSNA